MSKKFKISTLVASILVGGLLVGCGSSNDGSTTNNDGNGDGSTEPVAEFDVKTVSGLVPVIEATVFSVNDGTTSRVGTSETESVKKAKEIFANPKTDSIVEATTEGSKYKFQKGKVALTDKVVSFNGYFDNDKDGKKSNGDTEALTYVSEGAYKNINAFTTIEALAGQEGLKVLGITKADVDTASLDKNGTEKLIFANAIINEAAKKPANYPDATGTEGTSYQAVLKRVLAKVDTEVKGGKKVNEAISSVTNDESFKNIGEDEAAVKKFATDKEKTYGAVYTTKPEDPNQGNAGIDCSIMPHPSCE